MSTHTTLWTPSPDRMASSNLSRFAELIQQHTGETVRTDTVDFYQWTISSMETFWALLWEHLQIIHSTPARAVCETGTRFSEARWFPGATLNFAENLLRFRDQKPAIIFRGEGAVRQELTSAMLFSQVTSLAEHLRTFGIVPGDRIAACVPNMPQALIGMLAATAVGAIWSSCSPDFGVDGIVDRFGQIEPRLLISCDGYYFKGKQIDCRQKIETALDQLPSVERLITINYTGLSFSPSARCPVISFDSLTGTPCENFSFEQLPSNHPVYIMFSSGTTGKPKCIIHGAVGTLLEQRKELELHTDLRREDVLFYQTTCGWMMWNWLVAGLASGATLVLFDGSPLHEEGDILFRIAQEEQVTIFGTNAKFLALIEKSGLRPGSSHDLSALRTILSTGSVLPPESFDYIHAHIKSETQISSISGGTDILGCFALGSPHLPVHRGELQTRSFGMAVEVFNDRGLPVTGEQGELVCTRPFPSMPIGFWNDPDGEKFQRAYFERFPNVWTHGDYVELLASGGLVFHGRSDATLNPGGVRIGTAELYRQVDRHPGILESLAVARRTGADEQIVLFVVMSPQYKLDEALIKQLRQDIRQNLTAFHVPQHIFEVSDLPRTRSGKVAELTVRDILAGKPVSNREALGNPEILAIFEQIARHFPD